MPHDGIVRPVSAHLGKHHTALELGDGLQQAPSLISSGCMLLQCPHLGATAQILVYPFQSDARLLIQVQEVMMWV